MKRALLITSIITLLVLAAAVVGQALVVTLGVSYTANGQTIASAPLASVASFMAGVGAILSMWLCLAAGVLGLVATTKRRRYWWTAAIVVAGILSVLGLVGMAWVILSGNSPVAYVTPPILVPLVAFFYILQPDRRTTRASVVS